MDLGLSPEEIVLKERARTFSRDVARPRAAAIDRDEQYPWDIVQALGDIRTMIPPIQSSIASPGPSCFLPKPPPWQIPCTITFLIGVFLGYTVPHWYRNRTVRPVADAAARELPARLDPTPAGPGAT